MKNCYIVAARPIGKEKYKLLLDNLRLLRKNTECCIILSLNYYPNGIENWKGELYDYLVYSDINEIAKDEKGSNHYLMVADDFTWITEEGKGDHYVEFGRAVNNLYLRGIQLGKILNMEGFICMNYDVGIKNNKFTKYLESEKDLFIEDMDNSATGELYYQTWCFKVTKNTIPMLEYLSKEENYNKEKKIL